MGLPASARTLPAADIVKMSVDVETFITSEAWRHIRQQLSDKEKRHLTTLKSKDSTETAIRFAQGALDGIACVIMLIEGFTDAAREDLRKRREET